MSFEVTPGPNQDYIETKPNHEAMTLLLPRQLYDCYTNLSLSSSAFLQNRQEFYSTRRASAFLHVYCVHLRGDGSNLNSTTGRQQKRTAAPKPFRNPSSDSRLTATQDFSSSLGKACSRGNLTQAKSLNPN